MINFILWMTENENRTAWVLLLITVLALVSVLLAS